MRYAVHELDGGESPLRPFLPDEAWFARDPRGIHGVGHVTRVLFWADVLAATQEAPLLLDELRWAAACHDVGRENDGHDPEHGKRSGDWVLANLAELRPEAASCDLEAVAALCRCHIAPCDRPGVPPLELAILQDADALDRARFRYVDRLDPSYLRLPASHLLADFAQDLVDALGRDALPDAIVDWGERKLRRLVQPDLLAALIADGFPQRP